MSVAIPRCALTNAGASNDLPCPPIIDRPQAGIGRADREALAIAKGSPDLPAGLR